MSDRFCENIWNGVAMCRDAWIEAMSRQGLRCRFDRSCFGPSTKYTARAGRTGIANLDVAWQSVSPFTRGSTWNDEHLYVQIVKSGTMSIEQAGQVMKFGPGDIAVVDPLTRYDESIRESARLSALYVPRSALRERGLRHRFPMVCRPDVNSCDVDAVRGFMLYLTSQAGNASDALLARFGDQCLDLMDALLDERTTSASSRSFAVTVLRAKQLIARSIGDPDLSVPSIAAELNMSARSLTRALQANGLAVMRYVWSVRLQHAAQLLAGAPQDAIQEIAYRCGFVSPAHFSRVFKKRYGMTPRDYAASRKAAPGEARE
ncbi:helix-turn-helix domain-containing protein [Paraburkholderia humisilvae]|uniref:Transcriptional activator FeaR n=1 Tax=Paraburkholderia humisilvae TaxID=627669 RepID=A0A6J5EQ74_9BURK|nr:helix-turn-helix domain-containing protein [Paraburkholderia humisilvae]CAB3767155.1 Transcriptional activator FeaR [Paraburkholderia humisilvae]